MHPLRCRLREVIRRPADWFAAPVPRWRLPAESLQRVVRGVGQDQGFTVAHPGEEPGQPVLEGTPRFRGAHIVAVLAQHPPEVPCPPNRPRLSCRPSSGRGPSQRQVGVIEREQQRADDRRPLPQFGGADDDFGAHRVEGVATHPGTNGLITRSPAVAIRPPTTRHVGLIRLVSMATPMAKLTSVSQSSGSNDVNLTANAAAVIGGTSLFGGRGSTYSALLGVLVLTAITSGLDRIGVDSSVRDIVTGAVLLLAVSIDSIARRARSSSGRG